MTEKGYTIQRGKLKAQLTRFGAFVREFDHDDAELGELGARLEKIEAIWDAFDKCQFEIEIISDNDPAQLQERVNFEETYYQIVGKAKQIVSAYNQNAAEAAVVTPVVTSITPVSNSDSQIKLPTLKLPEFSGDYGNFNQFKESFNSLIHENVSLSNIQKFHYLRSCLKSDAALVLQNLQTTDANYAVAWELIRERYENKRATINAHIKAIVEIECLTKESSLGLRKLYDTILKNARSLKNLEESVDQWDTILIYLGSSKLDYVTKRDWESSIKKGTMPTLEEFVEFLAARCHILETLKVDKSINCNKIRKVENARMQTHFVQKQPCLVCKGDHPVYVCAQFKSLSVYERFTMAKSLKLCLNCLRLNHNSRDCRSKGCKTCGEKHNTLLHFKQAHSNNQDKDVSSDEPSASLALSSCFKDAEKHIVLLSTAEIIVFDSNKRQVKCRALLDSGSQSNFMTKSLAARLNLTAQKVSVPIMGIGESNSHISCKANAIIKSTHNGYKADLSFLILPTITGNVPNYTVSGRELEIPANLTLADAEFYNSRPIDVLLGASIFYELLCVGQIKLGPGQPIMQKSKFGWLLSGPMRLSSNLQNTTTCLMSSATSEVQEQLERFWRIEEVSEQKILTEDEKICEAHFAKTHTSDIGGRFEVELPLRDNYRQLGQSREIATKRFLTIERKLDRDAKLKAQYNNFLEEYQALGHMTRIEPREVDNGLNYYLPHHGVVNEPSVTTRLRVVFDGSSKSTGGLSLNDVLRVGPTLQGDLFSIILRFRTHNFVITADIQKMYRQINVCVAPVKSLSIPRLELCAALLMVKLVKRIAPAIGLNMDDFHYWTDSSIVLAWLAREPNRWKTFVANRVSEIQELAKDACWHHVISSHNPADVLSRGTEPERLISDNLWWNGPEWLKRDVTQGEAHVEENDEDIPEKRAVCTVASLCEVVEFNVLHKFSRLTKLQRVMAYVLRFVYNAKNAARRVGNLTVCEMRSALKILIKLVQGQSYACEIKCLKSGIGLSRQHKLLSLNPFVDAEGVLRVGGRLKRANLLYDQVHQILLPSKHHVVRLLIEEEHKRRLHAGCQAILCALRQKYWIVDARSTIRQILRKCVTCFRANPKVVNEMMGDLPARRLVPVRPFVNCGVDFAGPFTIKDGKTRNRKFVKAYVCVFVCFSTKAVHLELAADLTTDAFLNALKRFVARRGFIANIHSDNGTNFVGASNELRDIYQTLTRQIKTENPLSSYLMANEIVWHFIPPRSPHFGGLWEASVKSVKYHLRPVLIETKLTYEQFYTVLCQIESILNSRPITPLSSDPNDLNPLTPGHFLVGAPLSIIPEQILDGPTNRLSAYQHLTQLVQHFWKRWHNEYLHTLQQRSKWRQGAAESIKIGTMVLLKDESRHPCQWPLGRVIEVHPGSDARIRVVSVQTGTGAIKRAINKICALPN